VFATIMMLAAAVQTPAQPAPVLVTTDWLAANLRAPGLVLFHIGDPRSRATYDAGHIPGAQFLNPFTDLSAPAVEGGLRLELPSAEHLDSVLEARGVSDNSRVVLYTSDKYFTPASRAFFALEYAGLRGRVSLLDGGLETWKVEARTVTADLPAPPRGNFTPRLQTQMVVDADFLKTRLEDPALALIDARDTSFYRGAETRQGRNGHIPGAKNVPFNTVMLDNGKFKDPTTLAAMLADAGATSGKTVITYCHIGQQASLVWFTARIAGFDAKIYDGSFQDWARRTELPVISP
jgi:thiosulfate/3-mercaptopyruvate sulfurtransferase